MKPKQAYRCLDLFLLNFSFYFFHSISYVFQPKTYGLSFPFYNEQPHHGGNMTQNQAKQKIRIIGLDRKIVLDLYFSFSYESDVFMSFTNDNEQLLDFCTFLLMILSVRDNYSF